MDYELLFPSNYIKSIDFQGKDRTVKITAVKAEVLESNKGKKMKPILSLEDSERKWVLNRSNAECLVAMFGRKTEGWIGKRVTLYPMPYSKSKSGFAIRVRGSPDIKKPIEFSAQIGWSTEQFTLVPTKGAAPAANGKFAVVPPPAGPESPAPAVSEPPPDVALPGQDGYEPGANG